MKLAENIRRLRRERDLTQEDFAAVMAVSPQAVSRWERGETLPDVSLLPGIAMYFGVPLDDLFGMSELQDEAAVTEALEQHKTFLRKGLVPEGRGFLREKLRQFPGNAMLLYEYATWYSVHYPDECLPILKRLLDTETDENRRVHLIGSIGNCYYIKAMPLKDEDPAFEENMNLAIQWAKKLPDSVNRDVSLAQYLTIRSKTAEDGLKQLSKG
jgi:transcriptional regulator with XRE-family HTH domain